LSRDDAILHEVIDFLGILPLPVDVM